MLSKYETYQILEFKDGNLMDFKILTHNEFESFKRNQFLNYINTEDYINLKQKRINQIDDENENLRVAKNKGIDWHKYKFSEQEYLNSIENYILSYTKKIY